MINSWNMCIGFLLILLPCASIQHQPPRVISGKGVYIFGPSLAEADTMSTDVSEALDDFAHYSSGLVAFARAEGLTCEYISARQITVEYATVRPFVVNRDTVEFGTIFTESTKEPLLLKYVFTDSDLKEKCKEYFHIK